MPSNNSHVSNNPKLLLKWLLLFVVFFEITRVFSSLMLAYQVDQWWSVLAYGLASFCWVAVLRDLYQSNIVAETPVTPSTHQTNEKS